MFDAARVLGHAVRRVYDEDGPALRAAGIDWGCTLIFGGQIKGEPMRLFLVYSTGNFIEATAETCYFQIGEAKYGKPVLDRMLVPSTPLPVAAKCALVSIDSTLVKTGIQTSLSSQLSYWDGLIVASAAAGGCERLLTEDLNDGQVIGSVRVENPFYERAG